MTRNIMLYGATGYSGRLIAAEAKRDISQSKPPGEYRMILGARDGSRLRNVADENGMDCRVFGLDNHGDIVDKLDGMDVVLNAAGPFAFTADRLAKAALEADCHYVDINGEVDVYMRLDDLGRKAAQRNRALVSGAGNTAAASDVLIDAALRALKTDDDVRNDDDLGAIRIAASELSDFTRGSAQTVSRSLREQVIVVRRGRVEDVAGRPTDRLVVWHEPLGKLERTFDFGPKEKDEQRSFGRRIASAANLIDTLTARLTVARVGPSVHTIESYVETGTLTRLAYQAGAVAASLVAVPLVRALTQAQLNMLPEGPTEDELDREDHLIVLEIEDVRRTKKIDWLWFTPNVYRFTAQLAVAVARKVAATTEYGWLTPAQVLTAIDPATGKPDPACDPTITQDSGPLRGCLLRRRTG